ncbi:MAG: hypothetical protein AAF725_26180, partial [Acidobacteriota bacterium]
MGEGSDELATSGFEIGKLVAQGDLNAAMEQLEDTIHRQRSDTGTGTAGQGSPPAIDPELPTTRLQGAATGGQEPAQPPP